MTHFKKNIYKINKCRVKDGVEVDRRCSRPNITGGKKDSDG